MAQERFLEYKADDNTFAINQRFTGLISKGVHAGFQADLQSDLTLRLVHTSEGITLVDNNQNKTENVGLIVSPQGVIIRETAQIDLTINSGGASPRYDLIYCEHRHMEVQGGAPAIYGVVSGHPESEPSIPSLTDDKKQIAIGHLYIPAGAANLAAEGVEFTSYINRNLKENEVNRIKKMLQENATTEYDLTGEVLTIGDDANLIIISIEAGGGAT